MILSQVLKAGSFNRHLGARAQRKKKVKRILVAGLMLTSMVDMFSLLVIFLLQSFSNSPEIITLNKGIVLPSAISSAPLIDAPVLAISADDVTLDHKLLGTTTALLTQPQALLKQLQDLRQVWQGAHPKEIFNGDIHLQSDKHRSAVLVSRYMSFLISQGYSSIHLAVITGQPK